MNTAIGLQEVHGSFADIVNFAATFKSSHWVGLSVVGSCSSFDVHASSLEAPVAPRSHSDSCMSSSSESCSAFSSASQSGAASSTFASRDDHFHSLQADSCSSTSSSSHVQESHRFRSGGVLNCLRQSDFPRDATCDHKCLVPGRRLQSIITFGNSTFVFININFYDFPTSKLPMSLTPSLTMHT